LLYVGKASFLRPRITQHLNGESNTRDVSHNFDTVECIYVDCEVDRDIYETYMINTFKPRLNADKVWTYDNERFNERYYKRKVIEYKALDL
jgi:excinuclease UvrABC nuclease subunit